MARDRHAGRSNKENAQTCWFFFIRYLLCICCGRRSVASLIPNCLKVGHRKRPRHEATPNSAPPPTQSALDRRRPPTRRPETLLQTDVSDLRTWHNKTLSEMRDELSDSGACSVYFWILFMVGGELGDWWWLFSGISPVFVNVGLQICGQE